MEGAGRARDQPRRTVLAIAGLVGAADRRPIIGHFMIVPLREHRHLRIEGAQIVVEQIVFIIAAKLREAVRHRGFLLRHDIAPDLAIGQHQFGRHRAIGVDVIAGVNEEVGAVLQHGAIGAHAPARGIDAPALPRGIARPDERYRTVVGWRGAEMSGLRFARNPGDVFEARPVENILPRRKAFEQDL
jgi:hypothetical protein